MQANDIYSALYWLVYMRTMEGEDADAMKAKILKLYPNGLTWKDGDLQKLVKLMVDEGDFTYEDFELAVTAWEDLLFDDRLGKEAAQSACPPPNKPHIVDWILETMEQNYPNFVANSDVLEKMRALDCLSGKNKFVLIDDMIEES